MNDHTEHSNESPAELFLKRLRAETAPMHKALENNNISKNLMSPEVSLANYAFYLACMAEAIRCFDEQVVPAVDGIISQLEHRKKLGDIQADLDFLYQRGVERKEPKPFIGFGNNIGPGYALGYFYVIEGSTLGGRVILKQIAPVLKLGPEGTRFFTGYDAETGRFWRSFLQEFSEYVLTHNLQEEAIQGAIDGFVEIGKHFKNQD